ncbi:HAD family phosphatase [bacterium]|nr:HAD family phosphatase [bacterium]
MSSNDPGVEIRAQWGKMIRAIFWDNDGVLVDTERLYFEATRRVLESVGVALTESTFIETLMVRATGPWHLAVDRGFPESRIPDLKRERNAVYSKLITESDIAVPGALETVRRLHGRAAMAIVTSSRREHFRIIHEKTGILQYIDFVIDAEDTTRYKPEPDPYLKALDRSGLSEAECLAVEDSERGLASAVAAGIRCVVIPRGLSRGGRFEGAWKVLSDIAEVEGVVEGEGNSSM